MDGWTDGRTDRLCLTEYIKCIQNMVFNTAGVGKVKDEQLECHCDLHWRRGTSRRLTAECCELMQDETGSTEFSPLQTM